VERTHQTTKAQLSAFAISLPIDKTQNDAFSQSDKSLDVILMTHCSSTTT
jgi:hypothetical protein